MDVNEQRKNFLMSKFLPQLMPGDWHPSSWRNLPVNQQPSYSDHRSLGEIVESIKQSPGIVNNESIERLRVSLERVFESETEVLIHAGDCAETFASCQADRVRRDASFISSLGGSVSIGRLCGQFAKPRSSPVEVHPEQGELPVFRGDIINGHGPSMRDHDPQRLAQAYQLSSTMYKSMSDSHSEVYISHECLLLEYEEALVRGQLSDNYTYSSSAHFLWIGDRTRDLGGAHIEFCRGLSNPIGIKVGPTSVPSEIRESVIRLNPDNIKGKVTIITRYGHGNVRSHLPQLIDQLRGLNVLYQCDPMHGNTVVLESGKKTRYVDTIKAEIAEVVATHRRMGSRVHGLHLEATAEDVTECIGVDVSELSSERYRSVCDPRLNPLQTKHVVAFFYQVIAQDSIKAPASPCLTSRLTTANTARSENSTISSDDDGTSGLTSEGICD